MFQGAGDATADVRQAEDFPKHVALPRGCLDEIVELLHCQDSRLRVEAMVGNDSVSKMIRQTISLNVLSLVFTCSKLEFPDLHPVKCK
jgi:hypothetical protein